MVPWNSFPMRTLWVISLPSKGQDTLPARPNVPAHAQRVSTKLTDAHSVFSNQIRLKTVFNSVSSLSCMTSQPSTFRICSLHHRYQPRECCQSCILVCSHHIKEATRGSFLQLESEPMLHRFSRIPRAPRHDSSTTVSTKSKPGSTRLFIALELALSSTVEWNPKRRRHAHVLLTSWNHYPRRTS